MQKLMSIPHQWRNSSEIRVSVHTFFLRQRSLPTRSEVQKWNVFESSFLTAMNEREIIIYYLIRMAMDEKILSLDVVGQGTTASFGSRGWRSIFAPTNPNPSIQHNLSTFFKKRSYGK